MYEDEYVTAARKSHGVYKIVLAGAGGVGKTCIASRLITKSFIDTEMTRGLDIESWELVDEENDISFKLVSVDLGGQSQFRFFQDALVRGASIALVVFDVSRYESLLDLDEWKEIMMDIPPDHMLLIGNKKDMGICMSLEEIERLKEEWGTDCVIISTKTGEGFELVEEFILGLLKRSSGNPDKEEIMI